MAHTLSMVEAKEELQCTHEFFYRDYDATFINAYKYNDTTGPRQTMKPLELRYAYKQC